jgi:hypothetical protein
MIMNIGDKVLKTLGKQAFTLLLCMAWVLTASAQHTVESIRKEYQSVHEWITLMSDNFPSDGIPPEYFDLRVVQNLPATGPHHENIRMYYGELEPEEEGDPYPPHYLRFTTIKYNYAAREFYEEYLYDDKGQVMFIYALTPDVEGGGDIWPYELRMWFDGQRLLRFNAKKFEGPLDYLDIATLKKGTFKDEYTGKTIPEKFVSEADRCKQRAQRYLSLFKSIDNR